MAYSITIPQTGGPEVLVREEKVAPIPGAGEVLVRNHATALNFIDTIIRRGEMPESMMPELPHVPGVEGAGIVEAVGEGAEGFAVGDRVAWMGPIGASGYGTYSIIGSHYITKLDDDVAFEHAASIPVNAMTAWHMLVNLGQGRRGQSVLVHAAAGGVGTMITHIAKHLGLNVIASVSSDKIEYAKAQGADFVVDYRTENLVEQVKAITEDRGVDLTLNPISGESLKDDMEMLAPLGTTVLFGFLAGPPTGTFGEDMAKHFGKSIAVRVSDIYTYFFNRAEDFSADLKSIFELLKTGVLKPQTQVLPLSEAAEAHRMLEAGEVKGKLVLKID